MPKIHCCLCSRRTDSNNQRIRIGTASVWPSFEEHAKNAGLDVSRFSIRNDYICLKCNSIVSHYRMNDRGPNKKVKIAKPFVYEVNITKNVLRGSNRNLTSGPDSLLCGMILTLR